MRKITPDLFPTFYKLDVESKRLVKIIENIFSTSLKCENRTRIAVAARSAFCLIMVDRGFEYKYLGRLLSKHHASIIYYQKTGRDRLKGDAIFALKYNEVCQAFYSDIDECKNAEVGVLRKAISSLKEKNKNLSLKSIELEQEILDITKGLNLKDGNNSIYKVINERTKPGTQEFIIKKLNRFYNGVYSEVFECY